MRDMIPIVLELTKYLDHLAFKCSCNNVKKDMQCSAMAKEALDKLDKMLEEK
jgi:hypothetical protein